ncbi:MAG: hypothetical protein PHQ54_03910 [Candidatus Omnitrophica bacterium]|nr:hypothetical protein [Candidatus Omnitrophota bacterium]
MVNIKFDIIMKEKYFYLAGRDINTAGLVFSLLATILGASSTVGLIGLAFSVGLPAAIWLALGSVGLFLLSLSYSRFYTERDNYTISEFLGNQYGPEVRNITSWLVLLSWCGIISVQIIALQKLINVFIPQLPSFTGSLVITFFVVLYTLLGGQKAVIFTDKIQFFLLILGFIAVNFVFVKFYKAIDLRFLKFPVNEYYSFRDLLYFISILVPVYFIGPDIHSRIFCARNKNVAVKALKISAIALLPISALIVFPALALSGTSKASNEYEPIVLFFNYLVNFSPVFYLFLIALVSALISSMDTCLMTSSAILIRDILRLSGKNRVLYARLSVLSIAALAFALSLYYKNIIEVLKASYSVYTSGIFVPFLLIPFKKRLKITNFSVFMSIIISGFIGAVSAFLGFKAGIFYSYLISGIIICFFSCLQRQAL